MFGLYFTEQIPQSLAQVAASNTAQFNAFFHHMLQAGVYLATSAYEAGFVSAAHDDTVIDATLQAAEQAFAALKSASR